MEVSIMPDDPNRPVLYSWQYREICRQLDKKELLCDDCGLPYNDPENWLERTFRLVQEGRMDIYEAAFNIFAYLAGKGVHPCEKCFQDDIATGNCFPIDGTNPVRPPRDIHHAALRYKEKLGWARPPE